MDADSHMDSKRVRLANADSGNATGITLDRVRMVSCIRRRSGVSCPPVLLQFSVLLWPVGATGVVHV